MATFLGGHVADLIVIGSRTQVPPSPADATDPALSLAALRRRIGSRRDRLRPGEVHEQVQPFERSLNPHGRRAVHKREGPADLEPPRLVEVAHPPEHLGTHEHAREPRIGTPNHVAAFAVGRSDVDGIERRIAEQGPPHTAASRTSRPAAGAMGPIAHPKRTSSPARVAHARSKRLTSSPRHVPQRTSSMEPASHRENSANG